MLVAVSDTTSAQATLSGYCDRLERIGTMLSGERLADIPHQQPTAAITLTMTEALPS